MKKRKGMSLVEVMMAFVLVGFLILLVGGAVTSTYKTSAALQKLPALYYKGQSKIENELDALEAKITKKYVYEKDLARLATPDPAIEEALRALNAELEADHEKVTYRLFGKDVTVYQFTKECEAEDGGKVTLFAGTAGGVRLERPVPVIETAHIGVLGESQATDISHATGSMLTTEVGYAETNAEFRYTELYQWYVSVGDMHTVYYGDGTPGPDEIQHGNLVPVFPGDFTPITSERTSTITVQGDYRGKFLFCEVTPLSINGKMGESYRSNLIYVSALPDGPNYKAVTDPSLTVFDYTEETQQPVSVLDSMSAATGVWITSGGTPYVDLYGEIISAESEAASRFLHLKATDTMTSANGLAPAVNDVAFAVARCHGAAGDFLSAGGQRYGFLHNSGQTAPTEGGWVVLIMDIYASGGKYTLSNADVDIAELIIAAQPGQSDRERIVAYLTGKYGIR